MPNLELTLRDFSPRYSRRPTPFLSALLYFAVLTLWVVAIAGAGLFSGIFAWTAGLVYVAYDTGLLIHVALKTAFIMRQQPRPSAVSQRRPSIAVLIAARNEVNSLERTLNALFSQSDLPEHICVIDDGSTDGSSAMLIERYGLKSRDATGAWLYCDSDPRLKLMSLPAGGKACALNAALTNSSAELVITVDADTYLAPDAVLEVRRAFANEPELVAACGVLTPICRGAHENGLFQFFQTYEYVRAFISRIAWMQSGALLLVSGAFSAFRRDALLTVGGFDPQCLVEDYEVIHRIHRYAYEQKHDWRVRVLSKARGTTEAPGTVMKFLRQRRRWFAGFLQTQYWNKDMTANASYGSVGRLMLPIKAVDTLQPIYGLTAFGLLVGYLVTGNLAVLLPVLVVIGAKIVIDLLFYLWWITLYSRWLGEAVTMRRLVMAAIAALAEPFSFQLLRHSGAAWGWFAFLTGRVSWGHAKTTSKVAHGA